jgi:hypothetical protein
MRELLTSEEEGSSCSITGALCLDRPRTARSKASGAASVKPSRCTKKGGADLTYLTPLLLHLAKDLHPTPRHSPIPAITLLQYQPSLIRPSPEGRERRVVHGWIKGSSEGGPVGDGFLGKSCFGDVEGGEDCLWGGAGGAGVGACLKGRKEKRGEGKR